MGTAAAAAAVAAVHVLATALRPKDSEKLTYKRVLQMYDRAGTDALKLHLGQTCDTALCRMTDQCIERNASAALDAYTAAVNALSAESDFHDSIDQMIQIMFETGCDLNGCYRGGSSRNCN